MRIYSHILSILIFILIVSCRANFEFGSLRPINHVEMLGNTSKWNSSFFDKDSNIVIPLCEDTFEFHFELDKKHNDSLIFSYNKKEAIGNLYFRNHAVFFKPKNQENDYKLFDFNAKINDTWTIEDCGPLTNSILEVEKTKKKGNETIQFVKVFNNSPLPTFTENKIKSFIVSSKYGITEINIFVGWAEYEIKIINNPIKM